AVAWVRQAKKSAKKKRQEEMGPIGPLPIVKQRLRKLPQIADAWQVGWVRLESRVRIDADPVHPWLVLVASEGTELILSHGLLLEEPTPNMIWDTLARAIEAPLAGQAYRPTTLHVRKDARWEALRPHLEELNIRLEHGGAFQLIDTVLANAAG